MTQLSPQGPTSQSLPGTNSPNSITKQRNKTKATHRNKNNKQTKQNNMIVGLLSVSDHFAVHASELLLHVLSRVNIRMHKTCTSTVQTPDITLHHIYIYISDITIWQWGTQGICGQHAVRTSMKLLLNILGKAKMAQQLKKKKTATDTTFSWW